MAQETQTQPAAQEQEGSLANFAFDNVDNAAFFGQGGDDTEDEDETSEVIKAVTTEDDDEELEDVFKNSGKPKAPSKEKAKTDKAKQEPEDEEIEVEDDEDWSFGEDEKKPNAAKEKPKAKPEKAEQPTGKSAEKEEETTTISGDFADLALDLKDKGTFQFAKIAEGEEVDEDRLHSLIDEEVEGRVDETFEGFFEEMDDDGKAFLKFKRNGGHTADFLRIYAQPSLGIEAFDKENKDQVKKVIRHYLAVVKGEEDTEEIESQIEYLEENGRAKTTAEKYFNKIQEHEATERAALLAKQQQANESREEGIKAFNKDFKETLKATDEFKGFKFSAEDKKKLDDSVLKPTVKVGKNKFIPKFNYQLTEILRAGTPEARQKLLLLAKLVDSDFDMSDFATKVKSTVVKDAKSRLAQSRTGSVRPSSSGNHTGKKSLADFEF